MSPPPATTSRSDRRKARTTGAILDAAERLFRERGYRAATIGAIAEEADVAIGSIYAHFKGKEELYLALTERMLDANERAIAEALATDGSALDRVLAAGDAYLRFHLEHPLAFRLIGLADLGRVADEAARARIEKRLHGMLGSVAKVIARGVKDKELRSLDPTQAATFLWGSWNGVIALHSRGTLSERKLREVIALGREVFVAGLAQNI